MIRRHWKKILLSLCALFWSGCGDDSSSNSKERIACDFDQICPEYGIFYECENEQDKISGNYENCTTSYPSCSDVYYCSDMTDCFKMTNNNTTTFECRDKQGNTTNYTEDQFNSKYYVDGQLIH